MSISRTSLVPSTIDGKVEILPEMPKRWAMSAMVPKPSESPILALIVLIDRAKASRSDTGPTWVRVELRGVQPSIVTGSSTIVSLGLHPRFERGEIDEQLERRSRLALGLGRAVVDRIRHSRARRPSPAPRRRGRAPPTRPARRRA